MFGFMTRIATAMGLALTPMVGTSEPLAVDADTQAQVFSFTYDDVCYAILPNHITTRNRLNVVTSTPPRTGVVDIISFMRFPEPMDLALGTVSGAAARGCAPVITDLQQDYSGLLASNKEGVLTTVSRSGLADSPPVVLRVTEYAYLGLDPAEPEMDGQLGQGRSGSVVVIDGQPVGIMLRKPAEDQGYGAEVQALRLDAAFAWLARFLERPSSSPSSQRSVGIAEGHSVSYELTSWSVPHAAPDGDPRSIADGSGAYIVEPGALPLTMTLVPTSATGRFTLRGIALQAAPVNGQTAAPRRVDIQVARRNADGPFRAFQSVTVPSSGTVEVSIGRQTFAAIRLVVRDAWDPSLPVAIDRVVLYGD